MNNGNMKSKDPWDKLDILGKLLTGVVLGGLAFAVKFGTDKIQQGAERVAASQKKGQLVQSLVSDLSKSDEGIRQDIAIIALDRSIGEDDPHLILDIAEQIVRNRSKGQNAPLASVVAFRIIEKRDKSKADGLRNEILDGISEEPEQRNQLISNADVSSQPEKPLVPDSKLISTAFPTIVYLQFKGDIKRSLVDELRVSLTDQKFPAPGAQRIAGNYSNSVRYFNVEDQEKAKSLAIKAGQFFKSKGCPAEFLLDNLSGSAFKAQKGHFELWISLSCNR